MTSVGHEPVTVQMPRRYYKATRPDGTDFYSGTVDYAAALASGEPIVHPDPRVGHREARHHLSVSTEATDCTAMRWPCRLFVVEPDGETWVPDADYLPRKVACISLRVVEEVSATVSLGPQGSEISALIERCTQITATDAEAMAAAWAAAGAAAGATAWDAAWDAARAAAGAAARAAAWATARDAAGDAAGAAARDAAWAAAGAAARAAAWATAGLLIRDLIGQHGFTQERYDLLTGVWRKVIGPIHPDDADLRKATS